MRTQNICTFWIQNKPWHVWIGLLGRIFILPKILLFRTKIRHVCRSEWDNFLNVNLQKLSFRLWDTHNHTVYCHLPCEFGSSYSKFRTLPFDTKVEKFFLPRPRENFYFVLKDFDSNSEWENYQRIELLIKTFMTFAQ